MHGMHVQLENVQLSLQPSTPLANIIKNPSAPAKPPPISILRNINVNIQPGKLFAIKGGSGSGKTSLLHLIAGRLDKSNALVSGSILYDGEERSDHSKFIGYVQQQDQLVPYLTVRETLMHLAALRLPRGHTLQDRKEKVESIITNLGLKECADTLIGDDRVKGCSGGEKRRVSIGIALLTDPPILLLDEPTSGLDSFHAFNVVETLVRIARQDRTVILTIHSPRSDIVRLFDSVILLSKGNLVYAGPKNDMIDYFDKILGFPCPSYVNPADHVIDISSVDNRTPESEQISKARVQKIVETWQDYHAKQAQSKKNKIKSKTENSHDHGASSDAIPSSEIRGDHLETMNSATEMETAGPKSSSVSDNNNNNTNKSIGNSNSSDNDAMVAIGNLRQSIRRSEARSLDAKSAISSGRAIGAGGERRNIIRATFGVQVTTLSSRMLINLLRDSLGLWGNLLQVVLLALVVGFIFFKPAESVIGIAARKALIYTSVGLQPYLTLIFCIYRLSIEMPIFDRERADNMYGVVEYIVSHHFASLPVNLTIPTLTAVLLYFMGGLRTDGNGWHFMIFWCSQVLFHYVTCSLAWFCISVDRTFAQASLIGNSVTTFFTLACGFFVQIDTIPVWLRWIKYISWVYYGFQLNTVNEFTDHIYNDCETQPGTCIPIDGNSVLRDQLGTTPGQYLTPFLVLIAMFIIYQSGAVLLLALLPPKMHVSPPPPPPPSASPAANSSAAAQPDPNEPLTHSATSPPTATAGSPLLSDISNSHHLFSADAGEDLRIRNPTEVRVEHVSLKLRTKANSQYFNVLEDVNFVLKPGTVTVLMGGSGSGKTTLLGICAGRKPTVQFTMSGAITFNGRSVNPREHREIVSYVKQDDTHLLPSLTVRETLEYAAKLRLPASWSEKKKTERAHKVMWALGLKDCANTLVGGGNDVKGISGGEKRRVSIGIQLLTRPRVLILDEPTSGLDAFNASNVLSTLIRLSRSTSMTILCSLHQPRADSFAMVDKVFLLTRPGLTVYYGPPGDVVPYLAKQGYPVPRFTNPADYLIDVTSVDQRDPEREKRSKERVAALVLAYRVAAQEDPTKVKGISHWLHEGAGKSLPGTTTTFGDAFEKREGEAEAEGAYEVGKHERVVLKMEASDSKADEGKARDERDITGPQASMSNASASEPSAAAPSFPSTLDVFVVQENNVSSSESSTKGGDLDVVDLDNADKEFEKGDTVEQKSAISGHANGHEPGLHPLQVVHDAGVSETGERDMSDVVAIRERKSNKKGGDDVYHLRQISNNSSVDSFSGADASHSAPSKNYAEADVSENPNPHKEPASNSNGNAAAVVVLEDEEEREERLHELEMRDRISSWQAFLILTSRSRKNLFRQLPLTMSRVMQVAALGIILCMYYARIQLDQASVINRIGILQEVTAIVFVGMLNNIAIFPAERNLFYAEFDDGAYSVEAFMGSYLANEIPFDALSALIFAVFTQVIAGLSTTATSYFEFSFLCFVAIMCGESLGIAFCAFVDHAGFSVTLTSVFVSIFTILAGWLSPSMPDFFRGLNYISVLKYVVAVMGNNEFRGLQFENCSDPLEITCYTHGETLLDRYHMLGIDVDLWILYAAITAVVYRLIAYFALAVRVHGPAGLFNRWFGWMRKRRHAIGQTKQFPQ